MNIAFIGTGNMADALASKWHGKHDLIFAGSTIEKAKYMARRYAASFREIEEVTKGADVVVLATPASKVLEVIEKAGGAKAFAGKVVVDMNNPVNTETFVSTLPAGQSLTDLIVEKLPNSSVVKAFNMSAATVWRDGNMKYDGRVLTVMFSADDCRGKAAVEELIRDVGADPVYVGDNSHAIQLEGAAMLVIQQLFGDSPSDSVLHWIERGESRRRAA